MNRKLVLTVTAVVLAFAFVRCGPGVSQDPTVSLSARPRTIANNGQASTVTITAVDELGKPGQGQVRVTSPAGSLKAGMDVDLLLGSNDVQFSCDVATDPMCAGNVRLTATWDHGGKMVEGSLSITVTAPDAGGGVGGGAGGGSGGGTGGATGGGSGGGTGGGSMMDAGTNRMTVGLSRNGLVGGSGDSISVTGTLILAGQPAANAMVSFSTTAGSFAQAPGTTTTMATTNASGVATVTLFAADAPIGFATVTAASMGQMGTARVTVSAVQGILYQTNPLTKPLLGTLSSNRETSTQVYFKVVDPSNNGVPGVDVTFALEPNSPGGSSVAPASSTNDAGITFTTLQSGDIIGTATIRATVTATLDAGQRIDTTHPGTPIVLGKPSDLGLSLSCVKRNVGALHTANGIYPPTRPNTTTTCTATLADRLGTPVGLRTSVQFFAERGSMTNPVDAMPGGATTSATSTHSATSTTLPQDVTPLPGEPDLGGGKNPRDMTVTIIAIVGGSEEFWDGSGSGTTNGRWDPGEWFVDLPEPYIDANDNGTRDTGETFFDQARQNCTSGMVEAANGQWDGPNGCYDADTQIWRDTHVQWTGPLVGPLTFSPTMPPFTIPAATMRMFNFAWTDAYGSPLSADSANLTVMQSGTMVGTVTLSALGTNADSMGFVPVYEVLSATEVDAGVFTINGNCDSLAPAPAPRTRCIHRTSMTMFGVGNTGQLTFTGRTAGTLADGGVRPVTTGTVTLQGSHAFTSPVQRQFTVDYQ